MTLTYESSNHWNTVVSYPLFNMILPGSISVGVQASTFHILLLETLLTENTLESILDPFYL